MLILVLQAKPVFGALLIWGHRNIDMSRLGINIRDPAEMGALNEKRHTTGATNTATATPAADTTATAV